MVAPSDTAMVVWEPRKDTREASSHGGKCPKLENSHPLIKRYEEIGLQFMNHRTSSNTKSLDFECQFRAHFGVPPIICAHIWVLMEPDTLQVGSKIEHLLWALFLLKAYQTKSVNCTMAGGIHEQTWCDPAWYFIKCIAQLESDIESFSIALEDPLQEED